jgi:hypothetical protein
MVKPRRHQGAIPHCEPLGSQPSPPMPGVFPRLQGAYRADGTGGLRTRDRAACRRRSNENCFGNLSDASPPPLGTPSKRSR